MIWFGMRYTGPKSVQRRMLVILITIFIPMSLLLYLIYQISEKTMISKVSEINQIKMEQTSSRVMDLFHRTFMATNLFIYDKSFIEALEEKNPSDLKKSNSYLYSIERLQYAFFLNEKYGVVIQDNFGNSYSTKPSRLGLDKDEFMKEVLKTFNWQASDIFNSFQWSMLSLQSIDGPSVKFITFTRWIFNPETATKRGIISIVIPLSYLSDILNSDNSNYFIVNAEKQIVYSTGSTQANINLKGNSESWKGIALPPTQWSLYQGDANNIFGEQLKYFNFFVFLTIAVILIIYIVISSFVLRTTRNLFQQIRSFSYQLANQSSNLKISIKSDRYIVELSEILQHLVYNLNVSRKNFELASSEKRNLEMQMLQQQMNPHFLLNTLNTIRFLADQSSKPKLSSLVLSLSYLLQQQLYRDDIYWTMAEEQEYLSKYADIQTSRFAEIEVDIHFEQAVIQLPILRMLLQPIMENCFEHAFPTIFKGFIRIKAEMAETGIRITVEDNGIGVQKKTEKLARKSIGLNNVKERMRLHYGDDAIFQISSSPNDGTSVLMIIPTTE